MNTDPLHSMIELLTEPACVFHHEPPYFSPNSKLNALSEQNSINIQEYLSDTIHRDILLLIKEFESQNSDLTEYDIPHCPTAEFFKIKNLCLQNSPIIRYWSNYVIMAIYLH